MRGRRQRLAVGIQAVPICGSKQDLAASDHCDNKQFSDHVSQKIANDPKSPSNHFPRDARRRKSVTVCIVTLCRVEKVGSSVAHLLQLVVRLVGGPSIALSVAALLVLSPKTQCHQDGASK